MDTRNGNLYNTRDEAIAAGVPEQFIAPVNVTETGDVITVTSGPFKGRQYVRNSDGSLGRRVRELTHA
jgi:hypothetical protein